MAIKNREEWLEQAVAQLRAEIFAPAGIDASRPVRVSVGWPGGRGKKNGVIGQCWNTAAAADSVPQIFISPVLEDGVRVVDVLIHEMIHAVDDCKSGHKGAFVRMARTVGLEGKPTATNAGEALKAQIETIVADLGDYPHSRLSSGSGATKQGTRMLKVECADCGYTARTTAKWLETVGAPICPCNDEAMEIR
jgi:hypothetical protein